MCYNCDNNHKCGQHELYDGIKGKNFQTGLAYSKDYKIFDLQTGEISERTFRSKKERQAIPCIEVEEKLATCSKCRTFREGNNYFAISRSGSINVNICHFCKNVHFSGTNELKDYVSKKLWDRYKSYPWKDQKIDSIFNNNSS